MALEAPTEIDMAREGATSVAGGWQSGLLTDSRVAERKLGLLKRTGLFGENLKGCTIERASTAEDLGQAYRLVHNVYLAQGFINPDPSGMRVRIYETTPETATFIAKVDGTVVGVLSVVVDSEDLGLPSDCVFKPELDRMRRTGARLCELTNQAVAEEYRQSAVPTELMRCASAVTLTEGLDESIAAISPSHQGFYELMGFRQIGSLRSYSSTIDDPVVAVSLNVDQLRQSETAPDATVRFMREFLSNGNRFLSRIRDWASEAKREFLNPDLLKQLFVLEMNFLERCTPAELEILYRRWGREMFMAVAGDMFSTTDLYSGPDFGMHGATDGFAENARGPRFESFHTCHIESIFSQFTGDEAA